MTPEEKARYQAEYKKALAAEIRRAVIFVVAMIVVALLVVVFMSQRSGVLWNRARLSEPEETLFKPAPTDPSTRILDLLIEHRDQLESLMALDAELSAQRPER